MNPEDNPEDNSVEKPAGIEKKPGDTISERDLCIQILTVSATLLGLCITVVGLIRAVVVTTHIQTIADDLMSMDSLFFLTACYLSYWAIRTRSARRMVVVEKIADYAFMIGLLLLMINSFILTYAFHA
jgi:hypothetical protein